jgi:hypothetical protein
VNELAVLGDSEEVKSRLIVNHGQRMPFSVALDTAAGLLDELLNRYYAKQTVQHVLIASSFDIAFVVTSI